MEKRFCKYCEKEYPLEDFPVANIIKGKVYRRRKCKNCYRDTKRKRESKLKKWLHNFRKTLKCSKCKDSRWFVLDFHHRNPEEKEVSVALAVYTGWGKDRILKEIEKCDVLCSNCHRELHWQMRENQK